MGQLQRPMNPPSSTSLLRGWRAAAAMAPATCTCRSRRSWSRTLERPTTVAHSLHRVGAEARGLLRLRAVATLPAGRRRPVACVHKSSGRGAGSSARLVGAEPVLMRVVLCRLLSPAPPDHLSRRWRSCRGRERLDRFPWDADASPPSTADAPWRAADHRGQRGHRLALRPAPGRQARPQACGSAGSAGSGRAQEPARRHLARTARPTTPGPGSGLRRRSRKSYGYCARTAPTSGCWRVTRHLRGHRVPASARGDRRGDRQPRPRAARRAGPVRARLVRAAAEDHQACEPHASCDRYGASRQPWCGPQLSRNGARRGACRGAGSQERADQKRGLRRVQGSTWLRLARGGLKRGAASLRAALARRIGSPDRSCRGLLVTGHRRQVADGAACRRTTTADPIVGRLSRDPRRRASARCARRWTALAE
jgi:hypothetical protein